MVDANKPVILSTVEKFTVKEGFEGTKKLKIQGLALPFDKFSRNGVMYRTESIKKQYKTMKGRPLLFNHNSEGLPIGKVLEVTVKDDGMYYEAEVDENETEIIQKIKNQYLENVSIQCMIENPEFREDGTVIVDVKEFLELSAVTIPGFKEANAQAMEMLKMSKENKKPEGEPKEETVETTEEEVKTEQDGEDEDEYTLEDCKAEIEALKTKNSELEDRVGILESRLDADEEEEEGADGDEEEESSDEEESEEESADEDEEEKPKEKLKRKAIPSGQAQEKTTVIDMRAKRLEKMGY